MPGIESNGAVSIAMTDKSLGVLKNFLPKTIPEPARATQVGQVLSAKREEHQDEGYEGAEEVTLKKPKNS